MATAATPCLLAWTTRRASGSPQVRPCHLASWSLLTLKGTLHPRATMPCPTWPATASSLQPAPVQVKWRRHHLWRRARRARVLANLGSMGTVQHIRPEFFRILVHPYTLGFWKLHTTNPWLEANGSPKLFFSWLVVLFLTIQRLLYRAQRFLPFDPSLKTQRGCWLFWDVPFINLQSGVAQEEEELWMLLSGRWIFRTGIILICWAFYRFFLPFCAAHIPIDPILQRPHFASSASKCRTKRCSQLPQPWRARMGHARTNSPLVIQLVKLDALGTTQTCGILRAAVESSF